MLLRNFSEVYKERTVTMSDLYNRIETLCNSKKISITTMCKESGASRASLSDLKVGRKQSLSADTLSKIAAYFNVSIDFLLTGDPAYFVTSADEENPWEIELLDSFDRLSLGDQIETVAQVQKLVDCSKTKNAPTKKGERTVSDDELKFALWGNCEDISDDDLADVRRYAAFVRERKKDKK